MTRVRVRGIYTTALTALLREEIEVVQASDPIERRFDESFATAPHEVAIETTDDRQGVGIRGEPGPVADLRDRLASVGRDAMTWSDETPLGHVTEARVTDTLGRGAVVDLGPREGFLPYDAVDDHVEAGETYRVQVHEPAPPWGSRRPEVGGEVCAFGGVVDLVRGKNGATADVTDPERAEELARTTELLSPTIPDGWGVRWNHGAEDASLEGLEEALAGVVDLVDSLDGEPSALERGTAWVWFGRGSRFALDDRREGVTTTMPGHHRIKAGASDASAAVDFVERLWGDAGDAVGPPGGADGDFPFEATVGQFGPEPGDEIDVVHGKPDGRAFSLGRAAVTERDGRTVTVRRELGGGGTYDGLGTPKESGDIATTKLREGRWWYPTTYRGTDGTSKGTYVNVCTPLEIFPTEARYVDLHVDVVRRPNGGVERLDDDELAGAVEAGHVSEALASKARAVAAAVERALS